MIRSGISVIFALALIMNATIVFNSQVSTATALNKPITSTLTAKTFNFQKIRFSHGVASGDVSQHSAVLWTRINQEGLLTLDISTRPDFKGPDFKKSNIPALEENDFAVKVTVTGLEPNHRVPSTDGAQAKSKAKLGCLRRLLLSRVPRIYIFHGVGTLM